MNMYCFGCTNRMTFFLMEFRIVATKQKRNCCIVPKFQYCMLLTKVNVNDKTALLP